MIVFDLVCSRQHRFEGWFRSSEDYERQRCGSLLDCPICGCRAVAKAPMAPAVPAKANRGSPASAVKPNHRRRTGETALNGPVRPDFAAVLDKLAVLQSKAIAHSRWVGDDFADRSRAMHYGDAPEEQIHGRATGEQAASLIDEGVPVMPLVIPIVPPEEAN